MRVLFVCGREPEYVRNHIILKALRQHTEVVAITDSNPNYIIRHLRLLWKLLWGYQAHDVIFVGFYGFLLVPLLRLCSRKPLIFDAYLSTYNTLCFDRKVFRPDSLPGRLVFLFDRLACSLADVVILDTEAHRDYFMRLYMLPPEKFRVLYLGCDEELFFPRLQRHTTPFRVFYYGAFLPLQGIEHIVHAARLLAHERDIVFQIAGDGMGAATIRALAAELGCTNIDFPGWLPFVRVPEYIAQASICLGGHFSDNNKAQNVIATKTYQFLAMARPTIVGQNRANSEIFTHGEHVYMCPPADPHAIAQAILTLRDDTALRERIAWGGYRHFSEHYSIHHISAALQSILERAYAPLPD